jgi:hypothetical protein
VVVVSGEAVSLLGLAAVELVSLVPNRLALGVTTTAFFFGYGLALAACAVGLLHKRRWSRAPLVLSQLIALGLAWSFARGATAVTVVLAAAALSVLVVLFLPSTTRALTGGE